MNIIFNDQSKIIEWVSDRIFDCKDGFCSSSRAIGFELEGKIICGVVYNNFMKGVSIEASIATDNKKWANKGVLRVLFSYPFIQLGVGRVSTLCSSLREDLIEFNERLGFKREGYHRKALYNGNDAVSFGMLKDECRWI